MTRSATVRALVALLLLCVSLASTAPVSSIAERRSAAAVDSVRQKVFFSSASQSSGTWNEQQAFPAGLIPGSTSSRADDVPASRHGHGGRAHGEIFLIRHGEKVPHDKTGLSLKGKQRAKCIQKKFSKGRHKVDYILAQDFLPNGRRKRPFWTVEPLAKKLGMPIDHSCERDDAQCAARIAIKQASLGHNTLIVWEHKRLKDIAKALGVRGIEYPSDRFDIMYRLQLKDGSDSDLKGAHFRLRDVVSEQCEGLDRKYRKWKPGKHKGGGLGKDATWPVRLDEKDVDAGASDDEDDAI